MCTFTDTCTVDTVNVSTFIKLSKYERFVLGRSLKIHKRKHSFTSDISLFKSVIKRMLFSNYKLFQIVKIYFFSVCLWRGGGGK